jgi:methionyl-tRNA synthetase
VVGKKCEGIGPAPAADSPLAVVAAESLRDATAAWAALAPSTALDATWRLIGAANAHLENNEPWKMEPGPALDAVMGDALEVLRIVCILATPAMPETCAHVWERIGLAGTPADQRLPAAAAWGRYPGGLPVIKGDPLFPRMSPPK